MARMVRIALDGVLALNQTVRPMVGTAWQYLKVEAVPPLTVGLFNGPVGRTMEAVVGAAEDGMVAGLRGLINKIDAMALRQKQAAEAAAKKIVEDRKKAAAEKAEALKKEADKAADAKNAVAQTIKAKEALAEKKAAKAEAKPEVKKDAAPEAKPAKKTIVKKAGKKSKAAASKKKGSKPKK